jgi:hypothetical protein
MYIYTVQAMPGQKAKFEGDASIKYRVKRVDDSIAASQKGRSGIIRENLKYDEAVAMIRSSLINTRQGLEAAYFSGKSKRARHPGYL